MEYFDILDRYANPVGQIAQKGTPLGKGMYYLGVNGYIATPDGNFLIQRRSYNKEIRPGCWDILMGHVMTGETSEEAMIRETKEEIGLTIERCDVQSVKRYFWERARLIVDIYFIIAQIDRKSLVLQPDEVTDAKLIKKDEMAAFVREMTFHTRLYRDLVLEMMDELFPCI